MPLAVPEFALVAVAIGPRANSLTMKTAGLPFAFVAATLGECVGAVAVPLAIPEFTLVAVATGPRVAPATVPLAGLPVAFVVAAIREYVGAAAVPLAIPEFALVAVAVGPRPNSLTVQLASPPLPFVVAAIREYVGAAAVPLAIPGFALVAGSGGGAFAVLLGLAPLSLIAAAVGPHDVAPAVLAAIAVLAAVQRSTDVVGVVQRVRQSGPVRVRSVPDHQRHPLGGRSGQGQRRSHQKPRDARQDHRSGHGHVLSRDAARLSEPSPPARNRTESGSVAASCLPDDRMDQSGGCLNPIRRIEWG